MAIRNFIHQTAIVEQGAVLGQNVKIGPFCFVSKSSQLSDNVELKSHVILENKVYIGDGTVVHPFAVIGGAPQNIKYAGVGAEVIIGKNCIIREYVTINIGTEVGAMKTFIGNDCYIMTAVHIAHDCVLGDKVIMANNATLGGHVVIENNVFVGGMTAIHQFVRIGKHVMIGGMSGIERDVIPFAMAVGNRARIVGLNMIGLKRGGFSDSDISALKNAYKALFDTSPGCSISLAIMELDKDASQDKNLQYLLEFLKAKSVRGLCRTDVECNETV